VCRSESEAWRRETSPVPEPTTVVDAAQFRRDAPEPREVFERRDGYLGQPKAGQNGENSKKRKDPERGTLRVTNWRD
jgi:hypothetical protein